MSLGIVELSKLVLLHFHREMMLLLLLLLMMQRVGVADAVGGGSDRRRSGGKRSSDICDRFHRQGFTKSWDVYSNMWIKHILVKEWNSSYEWTK